MATRITTLLILLIMSPTLYCQMQHADTLNREFPRKFYCSYGVGSSGVTTGGYYAWIVGHAINPMSRLSNSVSLGIVVGNQVLISNKKQFYSTNQIGIRSEFTPNNSKTGTDRKSVYTCYSLGWNYTEGHYSLLVDGFYGSDSLGHRNGNIYQRLIYISASPCVRLNKNKMGYLRVSMRPEFGIQYWWGTNPPKRLSNLIFIAPFRFCFEFTK